jgi:hypothetical protein
MKNIIWLLLLVSFSPVSGFTEETNVYSVIEKINREADKANTNLNYYEKMYLNLITTNTSQEIKGEVCYRIANIYRRDLENNYRKVICYSQEVLKYDSNILHKCEVCFYWSDAIQTGNRLFSAGKEKENFGHPVVPYLKGLGVVVQNLKIQKQQPLPSVRKYSIFARDPATLSNYQKKHEKEMAAREEWEMQNRLLAYRPEFRQQIWIICPEMKSDAYKVEEMVKYAVADTNSADKIIQYLLRPVTNEALDAAQDLLP